jgi:hypothetical protein
MTWDNYEYPETVEEYDERRDGPMHKPESVNPELKPCPFCGSKADFGYGGTSDRSYHFVTCPECMAGNSLAMDSWKADMELAAEHWNRRAPTSGKDNEEYLKRSEVIARLKEYKRRESGIQNRPHSTVYNLECAIEIVESIPAQPISQPEEVKPTPAGQEIGRLNRMIEVGESQIRRLTSDNIKLIEERDQLRKENEELDNRYSRYCEIYETRRKEFLQENDQLRAKLVVAIERLSSIAESGWNYDTLVGAAKKAIADINPPSPDAPTIEEIVDKINDARAHVAKCTKSQRAVLDSQAQAINKLHISTATTQEPKEVGPTAEENTVEYWKKRHADVTRSMKRYEWLVRQYGNLMIKADTVGSKSFKEIDEIVEAEEKALRNAMKKGE